MKPLRGYSHIIFSEHARHKKSLQEQRSVGTLVSIQKWRAPLVQVINRGFTGRQPRVLFLRRLTKVSFVRASKDTPKRLFIHLSNPKPEHHTTGGSCRRGARRGGGVRRGWAEQDADESGGPEANRPSSPPEYREQLSWTSLCKHEQRKSYLSSPKPGHTTGGSGRGAQRGGGAGSVRTGYQQNCLPRRQGSPVPPKASKTGRLKVSPEARTSEILYV